MRTDRISLARRIKPDDDGILWRAVRTELRAANPTCSWCTRDFLEDDRIFVFHGPTLSVWSCIVLHAECRAPLARAL